MRLQSIAPWLKNLFERLRQEAPAWLSRIGSEGGEPDEQTQRWLDEQKRALPYLYWPNI